MNKTKRFWRQFLANITLKTSVWRIWITACVSDRHIGNGTPIMDARNRQYMSENMDDELRAETLAETQFQDRQFSSQSEVIPPRKTYKSLWLFAENNPFRMKCRSIVDSKVSFCSTPCVNPEFYWDVVQTLVSICLGNSAINFYFLTVSLLTQTVHFCHLQVHILTMMCLITQKLYNEAGFLTVVYIIFNHKLLLKISSQDFKCFNVPFHVLSYKYNLFCFP